MALQLVEGQDFAADYSLLSRLHRRERVENWQALDKASGERVLLKVFDGRLPDATRRRVSEGVDAARGLVHPNIARVYNTGEYDGNDYIVCQYVRAASVFDPKLPAGEELSRRWPLLDQLLTALSFAHGLGLAHGHLHPGNILIDDQGRLAITDFGLPASLQDDDLYAPYLSPQVAGGARVDPSDDIFSLGQLFAVTITGGTWREGDGELQTTRPVPQEVRQLITRMLSDTAYNRPRDFDTIRDTVRRFMLGESDAPLEAVGEFRRSGGSAHAPDPSRADSHRLPRERQVMSAPVAFAGFALLVVLAASLFLFLPEMSPDVDAVGSTPASPSAPAGTAQQPQDSEPELTPLEQARLEQMEARGKELAQEILRLQVELEDVGVHIWGRQDYDRSTELTTEADEAYRNDEFETGLALYEEAKELLEDMQAGVPDVKQENLEAGNAAIAAGQPETAIRAFTIVMAIDPDDAGAGEKLDLAENLATLLDIKDEADYLEQEGRLDAARETLLSAIALEGDWAPALEALERVRAKIDQRRFNDAMSIALTALENGEFDQARENFRAAQNILPDSREPADGLEQVEIAVEQQAIRSLRTEAEKLVASEDWEGAIAKYEEILDLDDTLVFARDGLERAMRRHELDQALERFIEQPTIMAEDEELKAARRTLSRAAAVDNPGERLSLQIEELSHHISMARIPVEVELRSDNRTRVTVYRYGELGRIDSTSIELIPGQYTIVGKRRGYRDVEYDLTLLGGRELDPIYIACTEEI